ncbi:MAG: hypothetical protein JO115_18335 [Pseudonocardiales bacterium]|nr:hypothetical protein [Pseudonocardiales bacterium]
MNSGVQSDAVVDSPGTAAPEPGSLHLLMADTGLLEQQRYRLYLTMCGAQLPAGSLPPWECPEDCECDVGALICPDCVRQAVEWGEE